ncbi:hypothetical protein [Estrella lausannensis]|uniref:Uncharacterized protein n=1 Tax=Estrella lausannensis TaxID=483423 RepID=A0A0H5DNN5_9BACT|nr:hypothetical protein [Estrella lausannensis]CRX37872.1 hypothetical protein ELAC_0517 [Estrella lausannensis]
MSIESNQINHSNPLSTDAITQSKNEKTTQNGAKNGLDHKIREAIPGEIAHPQEQPEGPVPALNFQAKILSPGSEGTLPGALSETLLLNQESNENNHLPNLAADVMAHTIQSGQAASKLSAEEEMLADLNFDELSPDEIEAMLQEMASHEAQVDQKREAKATAYSADENELSQTEANIATEKQVGRQEAENLQNTAQLVRETDDKLTLSQDKHSTLAAQISSKSKETASPVGSNIDDSAAHKEAYKQKLAQINAHINKLQSELTVDPNNAATKAQLDALRAAKNELQEKIDSGMSHEEAMKTTFIGGRSLHEMTVNDLHEVLKSLYPTLHEEGRDKEINEDASKAGERGRVDRSARDDKAARDKAEAGKKEELLKAQDGQDRIVTELQYQQMRSRIEKDKEKLEESLQKILSSVQEDRRMKEIETTEIKKDAASDTLVSQGNKQKAINATQKMIDEVGTPLKMPVKKETLRMVVSVIRQIDSLPAGKSDPQIRDLQKTLIGFYQDIRQAVGVEVLGGTGSAQRLHTNQ